MLCHVAPASQVLSTLGSVLQGLSEPPERADAVIQALAVFVDTLLLLSATRSSVTIPSPPGFEPGSDPFHQLEDQVHAHSNIRVLLFMDFRV